MKYKELRQKHQQEFNEFPFIFAYNDEQFDVGMRKLGFEPNDTDKIYRLGSNMFYPRSESQRLRDMLDKHEEEKTAALKDDEFVLDMFEYEMANHEYQLTHDDEDVVDACGLDIDEFCKDERLKRLYLQAKKTYLKKCEENNWY